MPEACCASAHRLLAGTRRPPRQTPFDSLRAARNTRRRASADDCIHPRLAGRLATASATERSSAGRRAGDSVVAEGVVRSEAGRFTKAVVGEMRASRALQDSPRWRRDAHPAMNAGAPTRVDHCAAGAQRQAPRSAASRRSLGASSRRHDDHARSPGKQHFLLAPLGVRGALRRATALSVPGRFVGCPPLRSSVRVSVVSVRR